MPTFRQKAHFFTNRNITLLSLEKAAFPCYNKNKRLTPRAEYEKEDKSMNKISIHDILDITDSRLIYRNETGGSAFIELALCAEMHEKECGITAKPGELRSVRERSFSEFAYYELYDAEHTRLFLELRTGKIKKLLSKAFGWNFHAKQFALFYSVQRRLNAHGWTTLDLS